MFNRHLSSFVPHVYKDVVEMDSIIESEENIVDTVRSEMTTAFANTFVLTANAYGIKMFEKMLGIIADPVTEDLEFRRQRLLNRMSMSPPFTFRFLKQKLDETIGKGMWSSYIDFNNYTVYIESSSSNQNWYSEVEFTINRIKPCNMVFINVPKTYADIDVSEVVSYSTIMWKYRMGAWKLGEHPFAIMGEGGVIKMSTTKSIQPALLNETANFVHDEISYVLINNSLIIREFRARQVNNNVISVEYTVTPDMTDVITDIKLMRADGEVLTAAAVYVPVSQTVVSKHTITIKEGA